MENIIFGTIILSASVYAAVKIYNKIRSFIMMSRGERESSSCCGCSSCPSAGTCGKIHDI